MMPAMMVERMNSRTTVWLIRSPGLCWNGWARSGRFHGQ